MPGQPQFIADEGFDKEIVLALREDYDVQYVLEMERGVSDDFILSIASEGKRILLTLDKDFGELVFRLHRQHSGVVLCRLEGLDERAKIQLVKSVVDQYGLELYRAFTVIQPNNIRIRNQ